MLTRRGAGGTNYRGPESPTMFSMFDSIDICRVITLSDRVTLQLIASLSDLVEMFVAGPTLLKRPKKFFSRGPQLGLDGPGGEATVTARLLC